MQSLARTSWTGFVHSLRQQLHNSAKASIVTLPKYRRQHTARYRHLPHMESSRPVKRQRTELAAAEAQADSSVIMSTDPTGEAPPQQTVSAATDSAPEPQARKTKVLPVPQLVTPKDWSHQPNLWDCAALLVDKPQTWTSFDVCGKLKGVLKVKKIGHAGTLDPMATGLLIICTGKATKSIDSFQAMHKEYSGTMKLGEATNSYDADGDITETLPWDHLTLEQLQEEAQRTFTGDLQQVPPMFSALRVKGKRLYESAREGKVVERAARPVHVSQFDLTRDEEDPQKVHFYIACSKGTYIRSLAHDMAQAVGSAAHLVALRREAIGKHNVKDAWAVDHLQAVFGVPKQQKSTQQKFATAVDHRTPQGIAKSGSTKEQKQDIVHEAATTEVTSEG